MRTIPLLLLSALFCACAAPQPRQANPGPIKMHDLFPPQESVPSKAPVSAEQSNPSEKPAAKAAIAPDTSSAVTLKPPAPSDSGLAEQLNSPAQPAPQAAVPPDTPPPMTDTPPAADAATASLSCNHYNCATILSITKHRGLEDFTPGTDNGPGTYFATEVPEGNAVGQPQDTGAVFEKEAKLWEITVRMQDGTVQTMQQDYLPGVQVGDSVLIEGNTIQPWN